VKSARGVQSPRQLEFGGDRFELADVPAGPVRVRVRTPSGRSGGAELELAPGEVRDVDLVLEPGATVEGRVIDARNRPIPGASVFVLTGGGSSPRPEATTDAAGLFRLTGLPAGMHRLRLVAPGYTPAERDVDLSPSSNLELGDIALAGGPSATPTR
jgi:hypothetical protein